MFFLGTWSALAPCLEVSMGIVPEDPGFMRAALSIGEVSLLLSSVLQLCSGESQGWDGAEGDRYY